MNCALRRAIRGLRAILAPLWPELRRLNSLAAHATGGRRVRSAAFRAALSEKYRNHTACC